MEDGNGNAASTSELLKVLFSASFTIETACKQYFGTSLVNRISDGVL